MTQRITKAVFPVAGLGSRFLPATKASPKEMLPVVDKPLIQYAVEEAAAAGITDMIFVTGRNKRAIEDHFDSVPELEAALQAKGRADLLELIHGVLPAGCRCIYIRQAEPLGLGHAVLCAQPVVGMEPFAVLLADDLMDGMPSATAQIAAGFEREACSILAVEDVPREQTGSYGIVGPSGAAVTAGAMLPIGYIVEKPAPEQAPSTLGVIGRYVLTPAIFPLLAAARPGRGGEIQLTDAIAALLGKERVLAMKVQGRRYDCGNKLGYLKATVELGLKHAQVGAGLADYLRRKGA
ncbi:MAG: UTP--glucose-1-phosphate uridylyltransferase GalU [Betaproteobacteria bacterium]|nr:UTP--glucose-1-phosphate uridylyltransferase GalU [Betaproteobacteria bacterium]